MQILIYIIGISLIAVAAYRMYQRRKVINNWVKTSPEITSLDIVKKNQANPFTGLKEFYFYPEIKYEYTFNNKVYESQRFNVPYRGFFYMSQEQVQDYTSKVTSNKIIYVNPQEPQDTIFTFDYPKRIKNENIIITFSGILIIGFGVVVQIFL